MTNKEIHNVTHIDEKRIERLAQKGHYVALLEEFESLKLKFIYNKDMDKKEATKLVTLCKYFMRHAHNEPLKLSAEFFYDKYIKKHNL